MALVTLTSANDARLALYTHLTERQLRNRLEETHGILIAESEKVVRVALKEGLKPLSLLLEESQVETRAGLVELMSACSGAEVFEGSGHLKIERTQSLPIYTLPHEELSRLVGYNVTRGIHAAFERPKTLALPELLERLPNARRLAIIEGVTDATNVGALFRSAAALGVDGVCVTPTCCDPYVRRAVRVSMGTVFQVPWAQISQWPAGIKTLKDAGYTVAALALKDDSYALGEPSLRTIDKLALVFGTEGEGLEQETIDACDITIKIPMQHGVDSLNVAAASAVAFWDLC